MGTESDAIKHEIDQRREQLGEKLHELQNRVRESTDWRYQFSKRPLAIMAAAFGGGLLLSRVLR
jgi:hypothetical protein